MKLGIFTLLLLLPLASSYNSKVFLFPGESNSAYVRLTPKKPLNLQAFTLCMRVATELNSQRETILFAYRTQHYDELNVWQEKGRLSLYLRSSGDAAMFTLPPLNAFPTHLCVTWDSSTGATAFWVDGRRSMLKIYRRGHRVSPDGAIILGQDADSYLGSFDIKQSFVGEITDVQMWDSVLSAGQIKQLYEKHCDAPSGNVLDWNSLVYQISGNVVEVSELDV
ncbi:pentraxin fusion protein-like [Pangasianodon hypophthalmus]|uniref:pentraxin fusion protein-like n=1 Tax=Pangasianodon hypophthalmus TaxID=310915 RepID=UPI00147F61E8|nr:pentraxin fusion protein-like [Pangasianodon hypophthalmus]